MTIRRNLSMKLTNKSLSTKSNRLARLLALALSISLLMMALASCSKSQDPASTGGANPPGTITVTDHADNVVEIPSEINRIAICDIFPLASVLTVFFDSGDKIVGMPAPAMSAAKNGLLGELYPEILDASTSYIDGENLNIEELMTLEPDVVFYSATIPQIGEQLRNAGLPAVAVSANKWEYNTIETLNQWIDLLSQIFPDSAKADIVRERSEATYNLVQDRVKDVPDTERARLFFLFQYSDTTLLTSGNKFFGQWWADAIGAVNVAGEIDKENAAPVSMEQIYAWNPDLIFITNYNTYYPDDLYNNTVEGYDWSPIDAVQNKNVFKTPLGMYRSYTPGVDCPVTLLWMAKTAYPSLFEDIDIVSETKSYYKEVCGIELSDEQAGRIFSPAQTAGGGFSYNN